MNDVVQPIAKVESVGINETLELINLIKVTAEVYAAAKADNSIDYKDLTKLGPMIPALKDAASGSGKVPVELKNLDAEEASKVFNDLVGAVSALVAALVS